jgi:hypothetical protein
MKRTLLILSGILFLNIASAIAASPFAEFVGHYGVVSEKCFTSDSFQAENPLLQELPCPDSLKGILVVPKEDDEWTLTEEYGPSGSSPFPIFESYLEYPNGSTVIAEIKGSQSPLSAHWIYNTKFYGSDHDVKMATRIRSFVTENDKLYFIYSEAQTEKSSGHETSNQFVRRSELQRAH